MTPEFGTNDCGGRLVTAAGPRQEERNSRRGQAILELALTTPLLLLLIVLTINFGGWLYAWTQVGNAARAVANYSVLGPASAGAPATPNANAITTLIASDLAALPNYSSTNPGVEVCWNNNGAVTSITGACSSPSADPEAASFTAVSVDLTYTYTPFITAFDIPTLGIHLPAMLTSIHRRIVMRFI